MQSLEDRLKDVEEAFRAAFRESHAVVLAGGYPEPEYLAPRGDRPAEIRFTRDYLNSCLHEIAHWCVAGEDRRRRDDYGYWYYPDGRDASRQEAFFRVETKPQALEWAFSQACGAGFRISCDNLGNEVGGKEEFSREVGRQLRRYLEEGFPPRALRFLRALLSRFFPGADPENQSAWLEKRLLTGAAVFS
jgi:elongation factor P hydroxylase